MPRMHFFDGAMPRRISQIVFALLAALSTRTALADVSPSISMIDDHGMAPFAVHVNALDSNLGQDDPLTVRYEWNFGDSHGKYNKLTGWNAAHIYDEPGSYTIRLTITDGDGRESTSTAQVKVSADNRKAIHIAPDGDDSHSGAEDAPMKTLAKALKTVRDNGAILLRRGATFQVNDTAMIKRSNILIGAYGNGDEPHIQWTGGDSVKAIIGMSDSAQDIVIENLVFDSTNTNPNISTVRAIHPNGTNLTVRNCGFEDISFAMNCEQDIRGLLALNNTSGVIGAYFSWAEGSDHTYIGNTCAGSTSQHVIRFGGLDRCLIEDNNITNHTNSTIWAMQGSHVYIAQNELDGGRCIVGPNRSVGQPSERFQWAVIEANHLKNEGFGVEPGGEHVMIRNNVIERDGNSAITVEGYDGPMNRTTTDVRVYNNTAVNPNAHGRFISIGKDAAELEVANNLYVAPAMETGTEQTANVFMLDNDLSQAKFTTNLWSIPKVIGWGKGCHYLFDHWSDVNGYKSKSEWAANSQCHGEKYRATAANDLDGEFKPTFEKAKMGTPLPGLQADYRGKSRALNGKITVGAVNAGK